MSIYIRAPVRRDVVCDTKEDTTVGHGIDTMLENARAWIMTSRKDVAEGDLSYRRVHALVDTIILYILSIVQRSTHDIF